MHGTITRTTHTRTMHAYDARVWYKMRIYADLQRYAQYVSMNDFCILYHVFYVVVYYMDQIRPEDRPFRKQEWG